MDHVENATATPPGCWSRFDELLFAVEADPTLGGSNFTMPVLGDAMKIASHGQTLEKLDGALDQLEHVIKNHPNTLEAVLAAYYLSSSMWAPSLVLPFWTNILQEIVLADKVSQMEDLTVHTIESMACYADDAAPFGLDVLACFLTKDCPARVKECALSFFIHTMASEGRTTAFSAVADQSGDADIRRWNAARKLEDSSKGGEELAQ